MAEQTSYITLTELCNMLSITTATGRNWVKLGKLRPEYVVKNKPFFTKTYAEKIKKEIVTGVNTALKSRRNKKYVDGISLYRSYVSDTCKNIGTIREILRFIEEEKIKLSDTLLRAITAECALQLFADKLGLSFCGKARLLQLYINKEISIGKYDCLIDDLLGEKIFDKIIETHTLLFQHIYTYEDKEDILGILYLSCKNISSRKAQGAYYTPTNIVKKLVSRLKIQETDKILDPCCGTGNFLLQLPEQIQAENIHGRDIDEISVLLARINLSLHYINADIEVIRKNVIRQDYLTYTSYEKYDHIIGNPPWGYEFTEKEKVTLCKKYVSAKWKNIESYDVFVEEALGQLKQNGTLFFVLPEAILNVKAHMPIREYILKQYSICYLEYLGDAFDGVQCPCIIVQIMKTGKMASTVGMTINDGFREYCCQIERELSPEYFSFLVTDEEYRLMQKMAKEVQVAYLYEHAEFAMGIVTGNNKKYLSLQKNDENEAILKGTDIDQYRVNEPKYFANFRPEQFQQVAPTKLYRAPEKLLYRFISDQLIFAYDDKQRVSLNSCNILIPEIEGLKIKYILAILNSRAAQFIYKKRFNSVKVLRMHIESIPIPVICEAQQDAIIEIVNRLLAGCDTIGFIRLYEDLDKKILQLYGLNAAEMQMIRETVGY